jgi:hypothetical protein
MHLEYLLDEAPDKGMEGRYHTQLIATTPDKGRQ